MWSGEAPVAIIGAGVGGLTLALLLRPWWCVCRGPGPAGGGWQRFQ